MHEDRIDELCDDIYEHAFALLEREPEMGGEEAGRVARALSLELRRLLEGGGE